VIKVSGAVYAVAANGVFLASGALNGKTWYQTNSGDYDILWTGVRWEIKDHNDGTVYYYSNSNVATPNLAANWNKGNSSGVEAITVAAYNADKATLEANGWTVTTN
jgi:hypothetical protein